MGKRDGSLAPVVLVGTHVDSFPDINFVMAKLQVNLSSSSSSSSSFSSSSASSSPPLLLFP